METNGQPNSERGKYDFARSTSQRRTFRKCGVKYELKYGQGWGPKEDKGGYLMGKLFHVIAGKVITGEFQDRADKAGCSAADIAQEFFRGSWAPLQGPGEYGSMPGKHTFSKTSSWKLLNDRGAILARVVAEELPKRIPRGFWPMEEEIVFNLAEGVKEKAIPDFYGPVSATPGEPPQWRVLDFKTALYDYKPEAAENDEQLTDYQLAEEWGKNRLVESVGLCVFVYSASPHIQWLLHPRRSEEQIASFLATSIDCDERIKARRFFQNDRACDEWGGCEMKPLCFASLRDTIDTKLVRDERKTIEADAVSFGL